MAGNSFSGFEEFADDIEDFADDIGRAADRIERGEAVDRGVEKTARSISTDASRRAPKDTGALAESIHVEQFDDGSWLVVVGEDYGKPVEYGRGPVFPVDAEVLRFEIDGEVVFAAYSGPAEPQPFLRPAIDAHRRNLPRNIVDEIREILLEELA